MVRIDEFNDETAAFEIALPPSFTCAISTFVSIIIEVSRVTLAVGILGIPADQLDAFDQTLLPPPFGIGDSETTLPSFDPAIVNLPSEFMSTLEPERVILES